MASDKKNFGGMRWTVGRETYIGARATETPDGTRVFEKDVRIIEGNTRSFSAANADEYQVAGEIFARIVRDATPVRPRAVPLAAVPGLPRAVPLLSYRRRS